MRTKFFCTNFLNTARGPGHPSKIPGTSRIPLFETQGRQSFEGGHEVFGHHPFAWKTPTPLGGLRTQKLNLCALFSCLRNINHFEGSFLASKLVKKILLGCKQCNILSVAAQLLKCCDAILADLHCDFSSPGAPAQARRWYFFGFLGVTFGGKISGIVADPQSKGSKDSEKKSGAFSWENAYCALVIVI